MRFHLAALPHTQVTAEYLVCAYTQKVLNFARMMDSLGHEVIIYASEESDAPGELVTVLSKARQEELFGKYDHTTAFFPSNVFEPDAAHWAEFNANTIAAMQERLQPGDFIGVIAGRCQRAVAEAFPGHQTVEYGVGYEGIFTQYRVFESYSHMHFVYGKNDIDDGNFYDAVIPNYFDPDHFHVAEKQDYFLYAGRLIDRKGWRIAVDATERMGAKLVMCGQVGNFDLSTLPTHVEHVGLADRERRAELMAGARALFAPTTYIEPFGGVAVEAMMSGTPVIATDFGAFTETIQDGVTGFRFRTLGEAVAAAENVSNLDSLAIREYAVANYSLARVRHQYQAYFEQLEGLWGDGWYESGVNARSGYHRYGRIGVPNVPS